MTLILHEGYGYSKKLCENVIAWYLETYYPDYFVTINVLHRGLKREHVWGYCDVVDAKSKNPRDFLIEIQTYLDAEDYVRVLLHEMVHVSQWIDGKLTYRRGRLCYNLVSVEDLSYEDQPHEKEAALLETVLYKQFNDGTKGN
jgi:hypothetical protein